MAVLTGRETLSQSPNRVNVRPGLFNAAMGPLPLSMHARIGGNQYLTGVCGDVECYSVLCQTDGGRGTKTFDDAPVTVTGDPFVVYSSITCSPVGMTDQQLQTYLSDQLIANEQAKVESVFSDQSCGQAPGLANNASVTTVTAAAVDPVESLSLLENGLAAVYGQVGVIHVPIIMAAYYSNLHLTERYDANERCWYTHAGNKVVFGNYSGKTPAGAAPTADQVYVYATGQVTVWRDSEVFTTDRAMTLQRTNNKVTAVMERTYVVSFECAVLAAQTKLTAVLT